MHACMSQQPQSVAECLEVSWKVSGLQFTLEAEKVGVWILMSPEEGDGKKGWQAALPFHLDHFISGLPARRGCHSGNGL